VSGNANNKKTIVPNYVTTSGFTEDIESRTKVGEQLTHHELFVYDIDRDTVLKVNIGEIPGIMDQPDYIKDYPNKNKKQEPRPVDYSLISWSDDGSYCAVVIRSKDYKDFWIMLLDPNTQKLTLLDRQRDEAWVGGPATRGFGEISPMGWLPDNKRIWFTSEETGYSHLYTLDVTTGKRQALTQRKYEVQQVRVPISKKYFYIIPNEVHPGEKHLYRLPINGGKAERLTTWPGAHEVESRSEEH